MEWYNLNKLLENQELVNQKIDMFLADGILRKQKPDKQELLGHILKADHNLRFVTKNIETGFYDWAIIGCYYVCYHAALAIILTKGYFSKNHLATLCILIREFYKKKLNQEEITLFSELLDYQDVLFYVESKNKREEATYSTKTRFEKQDVEKLKIKASLFVSKIKYLLEESGDYK